MDSKEKSYRKIKLGLALKKIMANESNNDSQLQEEFSSDYEKNKSLSFRKLESASGIRHATIVEIVNGKKNPAWSTIDALLEGLGIDLTRFAIIYDSITDEEILDYKKEVEKRKLERQKKLKFKK